MHALALLGTTKWTLDLREILAHSNGCICRGLRTVGTVEHSPGAAVVLDLEEHTNLIDHSEQQLAMRVESKSEGQMMRRNDMELLYWTHGPLGLSMHTANWWFMMLLVVWSI